MRIRKIVLVGLVLAIVVALVAFVIWNRPPSAVPQVSFTVLGYTNRVITGTNVMYRGRWIVATVLLTNESNVSISYNSWAGEPKGWVKTWTISGLNNEGELAPHFTGWFVVVPPKSSVTFSAWLPEGTARWRCGFSVWTASARERAWSHWETMPGFLRSPSESLVRLTSTKKGPERDVQSDEFEVKNVLP